MQLLEGDIFVSPTDLTKALACRHLSWLDLEVAKGQRERPEQQDEGHLRLSTLPVPSGDALAALEDEVLHLLDPPLNLQGVPSSPVRIVLKALRGALRSGPDNG